MDTVDAWKNKAKALTKEGKLEAAVECYDRGLKLRQSDEELLEKKGDLLRKLGRLDEALACYTQLTILAPVMGSLFASLLFVPGGLYLTAWASSKMVGSG